MSGQRIGYKRVSTVDQNTMRQLEGVAVDEVFEDKASGKSTAQRPALDALLKHVRKGDVVLCHSMDRMARNLDDLRRIVLGLTSRGVRVEFTKEGLSFRLLSDEQKTTVAKYGSLGNYMGFKIAKRNTFLIDPEGKIARVWTGVDPANHSAEVLAALSELQRKNG